MRETTNVYPGLSQSQEGMKITAQISPLHNLVWFLLYSKVETA
jgi:hypothetical protein